MFLKWIGFIRPVFSLNDIAIPDLSVRSKLILNFISYFLHHSSLITVFKSRPADQIDWQTDLVFNPDRQTGRPGDR